MGSACVDPWFTFRARRGTSDTRGAVIPAKRPATSGARTHHQCACVSQPRRPLSSTIPRSVAKVPLGAVSSCCRVLTTSKGYVTMVSTSPAPPPATRLIVVSETGIAGTLKIAPVLRRTHSFSARNFSYHPLFKTQRLATCWRRNHVVRGFADVCTSENTNLGD